ncbi:MAG: hypothetical protein E7291_07950 [Lachnospiraceae bacterium]|nr:hypothetical protein [Lachnospiraceae bacterium]
MRIVVVAEKQSIFDTYGALFRERAEQGIGCEVVYLLREKGNRKNFIEDIKRLAPDILLTTNLLGFEQCTLTDNLAYNLLNCKQIHLLLAKNLQNEEYLQKQLSIAMFFYCTEDGHAEYLESAYPHLPYIKQIAGWEPAMKEHNMETVAQVWCTVLREVMEKCHLH